MLSHEEATERDWTQKYVLGELQQPERERFEEHLFDCPACSEKVRTAQLYVRGVEATLKRTIVFPKQETDRSPKDKAAWFRPMVALPYAAMLLLSVGAGSQYIALRKTVSPQAIMSFAIHPQVKGEVSTIQPPEAGNFVELEPELLEISPSYQWELRPAGAAQGVASGEARLSANDSVKFLVPVKLRASRYELVLRGQTGREVIYPFEIR